MKPNQRTQLALLACTLLLTLTSLAQTPTLTQLRATFAAPPPDARPMVRWWWFGPAVVKPELARELDAMHAAGIGGVELAAEYPLALDDPQKGILNLRYGSQQYLDRVHFAADHARALGMRVDLTLGSGWPYGGPNVPLALSAGRLKIVAVPLSTNSNATPPQLAEGDHFIAAFIANGTPQHYDAATAHQLPNTALPTSLASATNTSPQVELFFFSSHTRQQVKRAAFGGEGFVLDHMAKAAVDHYLATTGDALLSAFPARPPYAIFSDSLEVYGSDWTPGLPAEFQRLRGYNLIPHLPELAEGGTPQADSVRRDWGETLSDLMRDNYLRTMAHYAAAHHTLFRSQTYGEPAVTLFDEHIPQLPEGEGPQWHAFSFTRWASSANHVFGNNITSAETFTWLHSPAFRATPLDMKAEADRMFLEGVNQIVCHGYPYSAPGVAEPGWSLYAAAALNDHNPWWPVMPYVMKYLQRVSWALRQGQPANDVALLLPEADAQAAFRPGHVSVTDEMHRMITPALMGAILDTGYNLDYIDVSSVEALESSASSNADRRADQGSGSGGPSGVAAGFSPRKMSSPKGGFSPGAARGLHYPIVVVPPTQRMPLSGVHALEQYVAHGGKLIFLGETPTLAAGLADAADTPAVAQGIRSLLKNSTHVDTTAQLAAELPKLLAPDVALGDAGGKVGFLHRRLPNADLYFFANTTPDPITLPLHLRSPRPHAEWWDPDSGEATLADLKQSLILPPYGSRLLVLLSATSNHEKLHNETTSEPQKLTTFAGDRVDKLDDWTVSFPRSKGSPAFPTERHVRDTLWTDSPATRFYSGEVIYSTRFAAHPLHPGERALLRFSPGNPLPDTQPLLASGMRAWFDPPLREAALIYLNGKEIGALWHPPYDLPLPVQSGQNTLEIHIFNTAINGLAGQPPRDYTALRAKYGNRFQMQDMEDLKPIPSGIEGPVEIEYITAAEDR